RNSAKQNMDAIQRGSENLRHHVENARRFGLPCVVAVNRFPADTDEECALVAELGASFGAHATALNEGFARGGAGAVEMAEAIVDACAQPNDFRFTYADDDPIATKIEKIAKNVYQADGVDFLPAAQQR